MELSEAQRLLALRAVLHPKSDPGYQLRKVFRWYSQAFYTPLHEVYELPLADVLEHYFECHYEELRAKYEEKGDPQLLTELEDSLMTPEERAAKIKAEEAEEMDRDDFAEQVAKEEAAKAAKTITTAQKAVQQALKALGGKTPSDLSMSFMSKEDFDDAMEQPTFTLFDKPKQPMKAAKPAKVTVPDLGQMPAGGKPTAPPDIDVEFLNDDAFNDLLESEGGLGAPPKKPQS